MEDLVSGIKKGNVKMFRVFFDAFYPVLCVFATRYMKNHEACKDVAQEALFLYWEKHQDFARLNQVKSFLYITVRNRCLNQLKREKINQHFLSVAAREQAESYEEAIIEQETYRLVHEAVARLPARMKSIIELSMDDQTNAAIARELGIADGTVHALKRSAYQKLRERLQGVGHRATTAPRERGRRDDPS
jgi:RNA polymerase sigma-70 factor (ECF subfamily)